MPGKPSEDKQAVTYRLRKSTIARLEAFITRTTRSRVNVVEGAIMAATDPQSVTTVRDIESARPHIGDAAADRLLATLQKLSELEQRNADMAKRLGENQ